MMIKVRPENLKDVTKNITQDRDKLEYEIKYWITKIEELKDVWQGEDADLFYNSCLSYVKRMTNLVDFYDTIGGFIDDSSNKYNENDESLKHNLSSSRVIVNEKLKNMKHRTYKMQSEKSIWEQK